MRLKYILLTPAVIVWFAFTAHADSLAVSGTATFYPTPSTISPCRARSVYTRFLVYP